MIRISELKVGGAVVLVTVITAMEMRVVGSPTDSYLAYREKVAAQVGAARMEDQADLNKKYAAEVNARLVKLVGTDKVKGFSAKAGSNVQSVLADDGTTLGPDVLFLKSDDGNVNLFVTMVPLLRVWANTADAGLKSTDDVAVISDSKAFHTGLFCRAAMVFRFAELSAERKPVDAMVKAVRMGESQD
ncbi:hypothetical protein [Burkholderia stabilis]|uniref:hypothetical protein n=1 Tax=Burkholderia stabilis TaxID=95485 RepID=UPI0013CEAD4F|nr:hypothetical protein [Burkholderia stabilis]